MLFNALGKGDHDGGIGRRRWALGFDDNNGGVNWGSRKYNASEWTSLTVEALVCLRDQGINNNYGSVGRVRQAKGLSKDDGGVGWGRGIRDASEGSETTTEAAGARQRAQGIYDDYGGIGGGRWARRLQQGQQIRRRSIYDRSKGSKTTAEATAYRRRSWWIGNDNGVFIFLTFRLLTANSNTVLYLSSRCIVLILLSSD